MLRRKKFKLGDLLGLKVGNKVRYIQYVIDDEFHGELVVVYSLAQSVSELVPEMALTSEIEHIVFVSLNQVVKSDFLVSVDSANIPDRFRKLPLFRAGNYSYNTKRVKTWYIWDGQSEQRVDELTEEQKKYPLRVLWSIDHLIDYLENPKETLVAGWDYV